MLQLTNHKSTVPCSLFSCQQIFVFSGFSNFLLLVFCLVMEVILFGMKLYYCYSKQQDKLVSKKGSLMVVFTKCAVFHTKKLSFYILLWPVNIKKIILISFSTRISFLRKIFWLDLSLRHLYIMHIKCMDWKKKNSSHFFFAEHKQGNAFVTCRATHTHRIQY